MNQTQPRKIVILGAGYGGLVAALKLLKGMRSGELDVTLVNKHEYHYMTTHLHVPAAGVEHHDNARVPLADLLDLNRLRFAKATVKAIRPAAQTVELDDGTTLAYDELVVGLGSEPETFGIPGLQEHAFAIRSINSIRLIRQHIAYMFAKYKREPHRTDYLTFVVGGAGFTGSEFVGELADRMPALCREFDVDPLLVRIYNVEAAPFALPPGLPEELVEYGMNVLRLKGVRYRLGAPIEEVTAEGVRLKGGEFIPTGTVIWAGGIRGNRIVEEAGFEAMRGRVKVDAYLRSPQYPNVYIIGDCSLVFDDSGRPYPPTAQIAAQQGENVARNILLARRGRAPRPFAYDYKGTVASLGKGEAVGVLRGNRPVRGVFAALVKKAVDARYLFMIGGVPLVLRKMALKRRSAL